MKVSGHTILGKKPDMLQQARTAPILMAAYPGLARSLVR
jgi:hypothetical protein